MIYTEKNGLKISKMTLGTVQLGMNYGINNTSGLPSEQTSYEILNKSFESGVTVLDTSDDYGKSEDVIGNFIKSNPSKKFSICTKFKIDKDSSNDVYNSIRNFAIKSIKRLHIEQIPVFMSHTEQNYIDYGPEMIDALNRLKKEGLIINSGISLSRRDRLLEIAQSGGFDAIQIPMNIFDNREILDGTIKYISEKGIAIYIRSIFLQGLFFKSPEQLKSTKLECAIPYIEKLNYIASKYNISVAQLAFLFIRDAAGVDSLVIGSETPQQVQQNIEMFNLPALSREILREIEQTFSNVDSFVISPWEWAK